MSRIMKVRTIPRGYVGVDDLKGFVHENNGKSPAEWFMHLYAKFGNPQDGGIWSYLLRHNNIVMKITAENTETMDYDVWVSPGFMLDAKRKKTKAVNVIARRLNEKKVAFVPDDFELYYAVRVKNDMLMKDTSMPLLRARMESALDKEEQQAIYGGWGQYLGDAKEEIRRTIQEIFDE